MLVLSRCTNEKIIIGEGENKIEILIVQIRGDKVRLGIDAAKHITVDREEIHKAKLASPRPQKGADAAQNVARPKGLADARWMDDPRFWPQQDDQVLQDKMRDEQEGVK